jgi:hypothetical protein
MLVTDLITGYLNKGINIDENFKDNESRDSVNDE